jgi:hypothetical protein
MLIWLLGVTVAAVAAYWSASDYHKGMDMILKRMARQQQQASGNTVIPSGGASNSPAPAAASNNAPLVTRNPMQEETLELEPIHALGFVIMASSSLFILFYFKVRRYELRAAQDSSLTFFGAFWDLTSFFLYIYIRFTMSSRSCTPLDAAMPSCKSLCNR